MKETENRIFFNFTQNSFGKKYEMLKLFSLQGVRFLLGHSLALSTFLIEIFLQYLGCFTRLLEIDHF